MSFPLTRRIHRPENRGLRNAAQTSVIIRRCPHNNGVVILCIDKMHYLYNLFCISNLNKVAMQIQSSKEKICTSCQELNTRMIHYLNQHRRKELIQAKQGNWQSHLCIDL